MVKEIGGYIALEINQGRPYWENILAINSGRNGIKYIIRAFGIKEMYVPFYTCPVVWQAIEDEGVKIVFYDISDELLPKGKLPEDAYILYTNYFGVCNDNVRKMSNVFYNLIVDNAQAFYAPPCGIGAAYSPRKFFGCSDGGYVYSSKKLNESFVQDTSFQRFSHLLKRLDCGANFGYEDFCENDNSLMGEDIKLMSNLTSTILSGIDYEKSKQKRLENFRFLEKFLREKNLFKFSISDDIPMYYPFLSNDKTLRQRLIEQRIYIPSCWRNMENRCQNRFELYLQECMLPLIIDQRYGIDDMQKILGIINDRDF